MPRGFDEGFGPGRAGISVTIREGFGPAECPRGGRGVAAVPVPRNIREAAAVPVPRNIREAAADPRNVHEATAGRHRRARPADPSARRRRSFLAGAAQQEQNFEDWADCLLETWRLGVAGQKEACGVIPKIHINQIRGETNNNAILWVV